MKKSLKKEQFIQQPVYVGGDKAMTAFIYQHLQMPAAALENNIEGTVYLKFGIDYKGNVIETTVLQGLGHGCSEEACRVVRLLKFDMGTYRGIRIIFHKKAKIHFKKPLEPLAPILDIPQQSDDQKHQAFSVQYIITPTSLGENKNTTLATGVVYSYNLNIE
jgi:TonB family protein